MGNGGWAKYRGALTGLGVFVFLIHRAKLCCDIIGIDTEDIIRLQSGFYSGWLKTGRQGLVLVKRLLGTYCFNPYFAGMMTLVLLFLGTAAFLLLWDRASGFPSDGLRGTLAWLGAGFLWISHPILAEQFYFSLQSMEICIGFLLTAAALYFTYEGCVTGGRWRWAAAFLLLLLTFSMYQVFVVLYVFGAASVLVLGFYGKEGGRESAGGLLRSVLPYAGVFLAAFLANTLLTSLFFGANTAYLEGQIQWGTVPAGETFLRIADHGFRALSGYGSVYYHPVFGILALCAFAMAVFREKQGGSGVGASALRLLALLALMTTPFWMTFLCGSAPVIRSQLILPPATAFLAYFCIRLCPGMCPVGAFRRPDGGAVAAAEGAASPTAGAAGPSAGIDSRTSVSAGPSAGIASRTSVSAGPSAGIASRTSVSAGPSAGTAGRTSVSAGQAAGISGRTRRGKRFSAGLLCLVCVWGVWNQSQVTLRLYYTDACRYEQDLALGREMITRVESVAGEETHPIVVVGHKPFTPNNACIVGEVTGHSFFDHDTQVPPDCYWSSRRVIGFLHTLGYEASHASQEATAVAVEYSRDMPEWPAQGSVRLADGVVIVKLSEPVE